MDDFDVFEHEEIEDICKCIPKSITNGAEWLRMLILDIEKAEQQELFLVALAGALIIPDLCGHVEYPEKETKSFQKYIKWTHEFILPVVTGDSKDEIAQDRYMHLLFTKDYLYQLRCFVFHEGIPTVNEKYVAKKESDGINKTDFRFVLVLDNYGYYTGISGCCESPDYSDTLQGFTKVSEKLKRKKTIEIEVSAGEICENIRIAAQKYLDKNGEKFIDMNNFEVLDKRE